MDKEMIGNLTTYGGSLTACGTAPAALSNDSAMLLIFSALGAMTALCGLLYTVWNGNRNFKLQQQELELRRLELDAENALR